MWKKKSQMRNRYLQMQLRSHNVEDMNESVKTEFLNINELKKLVVNSKNVQSIRSKLREDVNLNASYGDWRLPTLLKEILSKDCQIQLSAMNTLSQVLLDQLECQRAIFRFDIITRLRNMMLRRMRQPKKSQRIIPIILRCLAILAISYHGSFQIAQKPNLMAKLYEMLYSPKYAIPASCVLNNLSKKPQVLQYLIHKTSGYEELCTTLKSIEIGLAEPCLLEYFSEFLKVHPQPAVDNGFLEIILKEVHKEQDTQQMLIQCLALLINCREGQERFDKFNGTQILYQLLSDDSLETHEYVAQALQNATAGNKIAIWRCSEFWDIANLLIQRAHVKDNHLQQLYCLKTLRQLTNLNSVQKYVSNMCIPQIQNIHCNDYELVKKEKRMLLILLKREADPVTTHTCVYEGI